MTNINCLEDVRCPKCGQEDRFEIEASAMCMVTDDGAEAAHDLEWDRKSFTRCPACQFAGELRDFRDQERGLNRPRPVPRVPGGFLLGSV